TCVFVLDQSKDGHNSPRQSIRISAKVAKGTAKDAKKCPGAQRLSSRPLRLSPRPLPLRALDLGRRQISTQQPAQFCGRNSQPQIELPKECINRTYFIKSHLVDQLLKHQRIIREQVYSPLPVVESNRTGNNLPHFAGIPP